MVKFTVYSFGEHTIDNLVVTGPCRDIIMTMTELFLASYTGPPDSDLDYAFAEYIIGMSMGQGQILAWEPTSPQTIQ